MEYLKFSLHNSNPQIGKQIDEVNYTYHINTFPFPLVHGHEDYWEFTIITDGTLVNITDSGEETFEKDTMFFSTTRDVHSIKRKSAQLRYINLIVREQSLIQLASAISPRFWEDLRSAKKKYMHLKSYVIEEIEELIHRVNMLDKSQYHKYNDLLCGATLLLLQNLFVQFVEGIPKQTHGWQSRLANLMSRKEFLTYNVDDLCRELDYSRMQLSRLFTQQFGVTPHKYLVNYKLQYAANILRSTDMKVIEVAQLVGYTKLSQFNVNFKQRYGVTPGNYRRQPDGSKTSVDN